MHIQYSIMNLGFGVTEFFFCVCLFNPSNIYQKFKKKIKNKKLLYLNPQRTGVFYKRKGRGGGIMAPPVISARSNGKRLIFSGYLYFVNKKYFVKKSKRLGHNCLN